MTGRGRELTSHEFVLLGNCIVHQGNNHGRSTREPQGSAISMNDAVAEVLVLQQPSRRLSQRDADKSTNGALRLQSRHPRQVPHQLNSLARLNGRASQPITQGENSKGVHAAALEEGKTQDLDVQGDSGAIGVNVRRAHTVEQPVRQSIVKEADFDDGTVEPIVVPRINIHRVKRNLNVRGKTLAQVSRQNLFRLCDSRLAADHVSMRELTLLILNCLCCVGCSSATGGETSAQVQAAAKPFKVG